MQLRSSAQKKKKKNLNESECRSCMSPAASESPGVLFCLHVAYFSLYDCFPFMGFSSREAVQTKGPVRPCFIYAAPLRFTRHARTQTSGIQYFTAGVKFQRLPAVSPMRLLSRHNRGRRPAERRLCSCLNSTAHAALQTPRRRQASAVAVIQASRRAERPS